MHVETAVQDARNAVRTGLSNTLHSVQDVTARIAALGELTAGQSPECRAEVRRHLDAAEQSLRAAMAAAGWMPV